MEDLGTGPCTLVLESRKVRLKDGTTDDVASLLLDCTPDWKFGGVDAVRRINKNWVEVILWRIEKIA